MGWLWPLCMGCYCMGWLWALRDTRLWPKAGPLLAQIWHWDPAAILVSWRLAYNLCLVCGGEFSCCQTPGKKGCMHNTTDIWTGQSFSSEFLYALDWGQSASPKEVMQNGHHQKIRADEKTSCILTLFGKRGCIRQTLFNSPVETNRLKMLITSDPADTESMLD